MKHKQRQGRMLLAWNFNFQSFVKVEETGARRTRGSEKDDDMHENQTRVLNTSPSF